MKKEITSNWTPELVQEEALKSREILFKDPILGFDYASAGVRTNASVEDEENRVNAITNNLVRFVFISHRHLIMDVAGRIVNLHAPNEFGNYNNRNDKDSKTNNPYLKIAREIRKYRNLKHKRIMKIENNKTIADAIQAAAIKMIEGIKSKKSDKSTLIETFKTQVSLISNGIVQLDVYEYKNGRISIDFKKWERFNKMHSSKIPGKYNVNSVAEKILETLQHSKEQRIEKCNEENITQSSEITNNMLQCDVNSLVEVVIEFLTAHLNTKSLVAKFVQLRKQNVSALLNETSNGLMTCEIKNDYIRMEVVNVQRTIVTEGKNLKEIITELRENLNQLIVLAAINSKTHDKLLSIVTEESLEELASKIFTKETSSSAQDEQVVLTVTNHRKVDKHSVNSFNKKL